MLNNTHLQRSLERLVNEGIRNLNDTKPLHPDTQNVLIGSIIVAMYGWVELKINPDWTVLHDSQQQKPFAWISWDEFVNLHKIRHCYAHRMDGTMLANYANDITTFHQRLSNKEIEYERLDGEIDIIKPYYDISNGKIILKPRAVSRTMQLTIMYYSKATGTALV